MTGREAAFRILCQVYLEKAYSQLLLKNSLEGMSEQDKAFVSRCVYGTIQNYRYVEHVWKKYANKVDDKKIKVLLSMSVYQLLFMDGVPAYAVVNEACELARKIHRRYVPFVNSVLHRVCEDDHSISETNEDERFCIEVSHPTWMYKMWKKHYGEEVAQQICYCNNETPRSVARVNTLKISRDALCEKYGFEKGSLSEDAVYLPSGNATLLEGYKLGEFALQDESGQMVAIYSGVKRGDRVLDACAAPGSKSMHMAMRMGNTGEIIAQDIHEHRVKLIEEAASRLGVTCIKCYANDSLKCHEIYEAESFDVVVLDAPCMGLGVISRKPDIRLNTKQEDMDEILHLQRDLLESVYSLVKKGGTLVYSTCSLNKKENEMQSSAFRERHPEFVVERERTIFPFEAHSDGFYICVMKREI